MIARRLLGLLFILAAPALRAQSPLDSSIIAMFPKDVSELGYADLDRARKFDWYPQLEAQLVPGSLFGFEQFLEAAQLQQTSPIDQVAWGLVDPVSANSGSSAPKPKGGQLVAVAIGHFDPDAIRSYLTSRKVASIQVGDYSLYSAGTASGPASGQGDAFFTVIDSGTIAFGPIGPLKRILSIRNGGEENLLENDKMIAMIDRANGDGIFWGVLDSTGAGLAIQQLVPEAAKFPQAHDLIAKMNELVITITASSNIEIDFQVGSGSAPEAILLSQLLQAGLLYQRYQTSGTNPDLARILDGVRVSADSDTLELSLDLTEDQALGLIEHDTFSSWL